MNSSGIDFLIEESRIKKASDLFTDREEPRKVFWNHFNNLSNYLRDRKKGNKEASKTSNAILYYGVGGIGKTTLLNKLRQELSEEKGKKYRFAKYDFDRSVNPQCTRDDCIRKLCKQLSDNYDFKFILTELAFMKIAGESGGEFSRKKATVNQMIDDSRVLKPLFIILKYIPVVGSLVSSGLAAFEIAETAVDKPILELFQQNEEKCRRYIRYIQEADVNVIQSQIHTLFAEDLEINLSKAMNPLIIMLDTFEQYVNVVEGGYKGSALTADDWLKNPNTGLIHCTPSVLWVICGRDKLISKTLHLNGFSWADIGLDEHLLGNLSEQDTRLYLQKIGIRDLDLIKNLYMVTNGLPVFLDFCYEIFRGNADNPEKQNNIETYGQTPERIIDRYLQGMSQNMLDLVVSMSCLNYWTDDLVSYLRPEISGFSDITYKNFLSLSLVNKTEDRYYMHDIVKKLIITSMATTELVTRVKSKAASYYKEKLDEFADDIAINLAAFVSYSLAICTDETQCIALLKAITSPMDILMFLRLFDELYNIVAKFELFEKKNQELEQRLKIITSGISMNSGKYREAYELLSTIEGLASDDFDEVQDYLMHGKAIYGIVLLKTNHASLEVVEYWEKLVAFNKKKLGMENSYTLRSISDLASAHLRAGNFHKVIEMSEIYQQFAMKLWGDGNIGLSFVLQITAAAYENLGETRKALGLGERAYELNRKLFGEDNYETLSSLEKLANYHWKLGDSKQALEFSERVYELRKRIFGEEHPDTLSTLGTLAHYYGTVGKYERTMEISKKVIDLCNKKTLVEEDPDAIALLESLARCHWEIGDYKQALEISERVFELQKKIWGEDYPDVLITYSNLARLHALLGEYYQALEIGKKAYEVSEKVFGERHPNTLFALDALAGYYRLLGDYMKGLELERKVYESRKEVLGEEHHDTLDSLEDLADYHKDLGDYKQALEIGERVYELRTKILGEEHPDTLDSLKNLAEYHRTLGDYKQALEIGERVCELQTKILGEEHPNTLSALGKIAEYHKELGEYQQALEIGERVYALRTKILGEEHLYTLSALGKIAEYHRELGEYQQALEIGERVYALYKRILGEEHPDTLTSLKDVAGFHKDLGDYKEALEIGERVYELRTKILGEEHPDTLSGLELLAYCYGMLADHIKALEIEKRVYESRKKVLGEGHPDTLNTLSALSYYYAFLDDQRKALELGKKVYNYRKEVFGEEHPDTLDSLTNLYVYQWKFGGYKQALEICEKVYNLRRKIFGEEHPDTLDSLEDLANIHIGLGDEQQAIDIKEKVYELRKKIYGEEHPDTLS